MPSAEATHAHISTVHDIKAYEDNCFLRIQNSEGCC